MDRKWLETLSKEQVIDMLIKKDDSEAKCKAETRWVYQMMSNTSASGDEKVAAYWVRFHSRGKDARADGLFHIYNADITKSSGLSDDKLGKILKKFEQKGVVERKLERKPDATGQLKTFNWMALDQSVMANPRAVDFGKNTKHGGVREKVKGNACGCGCTERVVDRRVTCKDCGCVLDETRKIVGENELDLDPDEEVF